MYPIGQHSSSDQYICLLDNLFQSLSVEGVNFPEKVTFLFTFIKSSQFIHFLLDLLSC